MNKKDVIKEQKMLQIEDNLNELYLLFGLNLVNFVEDIDKKWDEQIKEYAKLTVKYVMKLNKEFQETTGVKARRKLIKEIVKRLTTMLEIITNAEKIENEKDFYEQAVLDICDVINNYISFDELI